MRSTFSIFPPPSSSVRCPRDRSNVNLHVLPHASTHCVRPVQGLRPREYLLRAGVKGCQAKCQESERTGTDDRASNPNGWRSQTDCLFLCNMQRNSSSRANEQSRHTSALNWLFAQARALLQPAHPKIHPIPNLAQLRFLCSGLWRFHTLCYTPCWVLHRHTGFRNLALKDFQPYIIRLVGGWAEILSLNDITSWLARSMI